MAHNAARLAKLSKLFKIPIVSTVQDSFGVTADEITKEYEGRLGNDVFRFEKKQFSMVTSEVEAKLKEFGRTTIVLYGCEAHICMR